MDQRLGSDTTSFFRGLFVIREYADTPFLISLWRMTMIRRWRRYSRSHVRMPHTFFARLESRFRHQQKENPRYYYAKFCQIYQTLQFKVPRGLPRSLETALHRLHLDVACTSRYLHLIGRAALPLSASFHVLDTNDHVLCHCGMYENERKCFKDSLGIPPPFTMTLTPILGPWSLEEEGNRVTKYLLKFLQMTDSVSAL